MRQYCVIVATHTGFQLTVSVLLTSWPHTVNSHLLEPQANLHFSFSHLPITVNCTGFFMRKSNVERYTSHMYRPSCSWFALTILPPTSTLELGSFQMI